MRIVVSDKAAENCVLGSQNHFCCVQQFEHRSLVLGIMDVLDHVYGPGCITLGVDNVTQSLRLIRVQG